jgi:acetyltransferase-like isoleucine patch superfamily enzyme
MRGKNNEIHPTATIHPNVVMGEYNRIGKNVVIDILNNNAKAVIGDNNIINDNTRIIISGDFSAGDWNVFHNDMLIMADDYVKIAHNCWFGQNTILDGAGGLEIGNGVRVGMYSQIWTHVASGEQIEGCTFFSKRKTVLNDDVWLVGTCYVGSGVTLGKRSTALINSVITKDTLPEKCYAGNPAKVIEQIQVYLPKTIDEKFLMLKNWLTDFVKIKQGSYKVETSDESLTLINAENKEEVIFTKNSDLISNNRLSIFYITNKKYTKTNSLAEREIYRYLYNNKARFTPL